MEIKGDMKVERELAKRNLKLAEKLADNLAEYTLLTKLLARFLISHIK